LGFEICELTVHFLNCVLLKKQNDNYVLPLKKCLNTPKE